jgi:hypothetical protein
MHPCREYWGQDVAYGSLVTGARPHRADRAATLTEVWIMDTRVDAPATGHAELAGLMRRIGGLEAGEESLRQSAAHLKAFLQAGEDSRILGIATLHRTTMLPPGSFAAAAGVPGKAAREASSALLCAEFMHHLGELGAGDGVSQIDWVMVRASDHAVHARSHLGATRVAGVALKPYAPGEPGDEATATASSAAGHPAA